MRPAGLEGRLATATHVQFARSGVSVWRKRSGACVLILFETNVPLSSTALVGGEPNADDRRFRPPERVARLQHDSVRLYRCSLRFSRSSLSMDSQCLQSIVAHDRSSTVCWPGHPRFDQVPPAIAYTSRKSSLVEKGVEMKSIHRRASKAWYLAAATTRLHHIQLFSLHRTYASVDHTDDASPILTTDTSITAALRVPRGCLPQPGHLRCYHYTNAIA